MKSSITFLLFAMIQASAFAQIDLKAFLDASYVQYEKSEIRDTNYLNQKQKQIDFRPFASIAYNLRNKDFHEIGISDIQYKKFHYPLIWTLGLLKLNLHCINAQ